MRLLARPPLVGLVNGGCWLINGRLDNERKASPGLRPQAVMRGDCQGAAHFEGSFQGLFFVGREASLQLYDCVSNAKAPVQKRPLLYLQMPTIKKIPSCDHWTDLNRAPLPIW